MKVFALLICTLLAAQFSYAQNLNSQSKLSADSIIINAYRIDQIKREEMMKVINKSDYPKDSLVLKIMDLKKQDAQNQNLVFPLIDQYTIGSIELSPLALNGAYYIIQHAEIEQQEKYQSFVEKLFEKKVINTVEYARFVDRVRVKRNKAQYYLTQAYQNAGTEGTFPYPLTADAAELVNKIGLKETFHKDIASFKNEYTPIFLKEDEFAIFGYVLNNANKEKINNIEIKLNGKTITRTNKEGFFAFKIKRTEAVPELELLVEGKSIKQRIEILPENDWLSVNIGI